jgi:hypothetical protein
VLNLRPSDLDAGLGPDTASDTAHKGEVAAVSQSVGKIDVEQSPDKSPNADAAARTDGSVPASASPSRGKKRAREDDDEADTDDARPAVRPKTSTFNWVLAPFRSFVAGFRAGMDLSQDDAPAPS